MAREVPTTHTFGDKPYLGFEHVTMVPLCRRLLLLDLLTPVERDWINAYHDEVRQKTEAFFEGDDADGDEGKKRTRTWLERETQKI
ncbi:hypothetical protein MMC29_008224 [Sticta canariensis]|nr:hypothetical protein [Sticta canariensis]